MKTLIVLIFFLLPGFGDAQDHARYKSLVDEASSLYAKKEFMTSATTYSAAFEALGGKGYSTDRYNAACSWALAGVADSAFFNLFRIAERMEYSNLGHITQDTDLNALHEDVRWKQVIALVTANKAKAEINLDKPLATLLDSIGTEDQKHRHRIEEVEQKYGRDSDEMKALWRTMNTTDSTNLILVQRILDERGWLGTDIVGASGNSTLFLVIQHSDQATQEKYLPMMREAVQKGNAKGSSLALLEDRVALGQGKRQTYGSQIGREKDGAYYVSPLEDPDHVDERRAAVGLQPLAAYVTNWDMTWDVDAYKKELPALEERIKARKQ